MIKLVKLEQEWNEKKLSLYSKPSPQLLNQLQQEHLLIEAREFESAKNLKKQNEERIKIETEEKQTQYQKAYQGQKQLILDENEKRLEYFDEQEKNEIAIAESNYQKKVTYLQNRQNVIENKKAISRVQTPGTVYYREMERKPEKGSIHLPLSPLS